MVDMPKTGRTRNKRATITDLVPETVTPKMEAAWKSLVAEAKANNLHLGTTFDSKEHGTFTTDAWDYPLLIALQLMQSRDHNKLMDSYADATKVPNPIAKVREVNAELLKGTWSQHGEAGPRTTLLAEAIAKINGVDVDDAQEWLDSQVDDAAGTAKDKIAAFRKDPTVAAVMEEIKLERQRAKVKAAKDSAKGVAPGINFSGLRKATK